MGRARTSIEQKRARDLLRTEKERLKLAFEAGRMWTWDWDAATGQIVWSEMPEPIHGLPHGSLNGTIQAFRDLIHPDDREAVESAIRRSFEHRSEFEIEFRYFRPTNQVHWMSARGRVFCDESGAPVRVIGVGMDITERKRSDERGRGPAARSGEPDPRAGDTPGLAPRRRGHRGRSALPVNASQPQPHGAAWHSTGRKGLSDCGSASAARLASLPRRPRAERRGASSPTGARRKASLSGTKSATWSTMMVGWFTC